MDIDIEYGWHIESVSEWSGSLHNNMGYPLLGKKYTYGSGHETAAVLLPGFAISW